MRKDIDLICENALSFNEEDSVYFQTAGKLLGELDGLFEDAKVCDLKAIWYFERLMKALILIVFKERLKDLVQVVDLKKTHKRGIKNGKGLSRVVMNGDFARQLDTFNGGVTRALANVAPPIARSLTNEAAW
jgi:hypothetical protein